MKSKKSSENRKYLRSLAEKNSLLLLAEIKKNKKDRLLVGLLHDESFHGCCGIFRKPFPMKKNDIVIVTIGKLFDLEGKIVWIKDFNGSFSKVGIYLK